MLCDTRHSYAKLFASLRTAEGKMQPVLAKFGDQVLLLERNRNA